MASGPSVAYAKSILDYCFGGVAPSNVPSSVEFRMWTVAPGFDGTGGTEATSGAAWPTLSVAAAVDGGVGQIAKVLSDADMLFATMTEASTDIEAISTHDASTGDMVWLNDAWTSPVSWAAGESPLVPAGSFFADMIPA